MRILHIGKYYPPVPGGMERFLGDLAIAQREAGHDVAVLVHASDPADAKDDPRWVMRSPVWFRLAFAPISPGFPFALARAVARLRPDVIHLHMPNLSAFWALLLPSTRDLPWVIHWQSDVELSKRSLRMAYPHYQIFERALLERAEAIVVTSPQYLDASQPLHAWRHKCHVVPLGVDPRRLPEVDPARTEGLWKREGLRMLATGRLTYYKGFETLLRACVVDRGHELIVVGEGEERSRLEAILAAAGNPAWVRMVGRVDDDQLSRLMASCDVFCLPSRERTEAFGIVLMEAMRYGKPLLVSDLKGSGVTWLARDGENAVVVPPGDVDAWREAIDSLAEAPGRRLALGREGRRRYEAELDVRRILPAIDKVYDVAVKAGVEDVETRIARGAPPSDGGEVPIPERLLIVIPALNEAEDIGDVIRQVRKLGPIDVLVVDDGSTDGTSEIALANGASVMRAPLWQGAWGAIQTGIRYAVRHGYSGVVTMDADGQHEPAYLPQMLAAARGADVVIASCPSRGSRLRHIAWAYFRLLTGFKFEDLTSGFRYYNARACRLLAMDEATLLDYQDVGVLLLLRHARFNIAEIPVAMNPRKHGASRVFGSWWTVVRYMAETSVLCLARWNRSPNRLAAPAGPEKA